MKGFINTKIYVDGIGIVKTNLGVKNGRISYIGDNCDGIESYGEFDNTIVLPGFIDQHIHGAAGADAMDGTVEALSKIAEAIAQTVVAIP